jgi:hypothetical protein
MAQLTDFPQFKKVLDASVNSPEAQTIYNYFAPKYGDEVAKKMVVLSNFESGWRTGAGAFTPYEQSIGLFQINAPVHANKIAKYTGTKDLATNIQWLKVPENNLKIAEELYNAQGFSPWTAAHKSIPVQGGGYAGNGVADLATLSASGSPNIQNPNIQTTATTQQSSVPRDAGFISYLNSLPDSAFGNVGRARVLAIAQRT